LADRSTRLIQDALTRAAAEPDGLPLFAGKGRSGLFPATAPARLAAKRCQDDGLLAPGPAPARGTADSYTITSKGLDRLLAWSSPREVLEDFLRILEEQQARTSELNASARRMAAGLESLRAAVERLGSRLVPGGYENHHLTAQKPAENVVPEDVIPDVLEQWHAASSGDCPLPELFRRLRPRQPDLSVGRFHDALRRLHERHRLYLHPWTGPLYELPEPPLALLVGHEIAYYASPKRRGS
jgi:hypothetical protein